jgi:translation initiation factor 2 subunit 3
MEHYNDVINKAMHEQATITIGMIGSVSNGKSTITKAITGTTTQRHAKEKQTNKTFRVGYANAKIYKCNSCSAPECYQATASSQVKYVCETCHEDTQLLRHISFTDVPGHNLFMATMLNGTCAMDYAILVESCGNDTIPSQQTIEHYEITRKNGIKTIMVLLNKVDLFLTSPTKVKKIMDKLRQFVFEKEGVIVPIIPVSGTLNCNIDIVCEYLSKLHIPQKDIMSEPKMFAIRSFNVNLPKENIAELKGGVMGGCLKRGVIAIGDELILSPGFVERKTDLEKEATGVNWNCYPKVCKVLSVDSENVKLTRAIPGGLIGIQLDIDPSFTGNDGIVGHMLFKACETSKFKVYEGVKVQYTKLNDKYNLETGTEVQLNVNANNVKCIVFSLNKSFVKLELEKPICVEIGDIVTISIPSSGGCINIYGNGTIVDGIESTII